MFLVKFWRLFWAFVPPSRKSWKPDPYDSILHLKHTHTGWEEFLSFFISTTKKCLGRILMTFSGPCTTGEGKVEIWPGWLGFAPEICPHFLECNSYRFPSDSISCCVMRTVRSHGWPWGPWNFFVFDTVGDTGIGTHHLCLFCWKVEKPSSITLMSPLGLQAMVT